MRTGQAAIMSVFRKVLRKWSEGLADADAHFDGYLAVQSRLRKAGFSHRPRLRALDIGCGDRAPLALLLGTAGAAVDAIDVAPVRVGWLRPLMWVALIRDGGPMQAVRQVVIDALHTWLYWRRLRSHVGGPLKAEPVRFRRMDAHDLRFPDETSDIVVSSAVWEHLRDAPRGTRELNRVLKRDGLALIHVPPFAALGGGHHSDWHCLDPAMRRGVRPWDYLRDGSQPLPLYCNGWRESQYRSAFERAMRVERWEDGPLAGQGFLTPAVRQELCAYSERELLLHYVVWGRKRVPGEGRLS